MERRALTDMEEWERRSLAAFRAVAREVRESSIVTNGLTIRHWLVQTGDEVKLGIDLLPAEAFRSLCVSVRKVYMEKEPASFYKVHNIVARYDAGEYRKGAGKVRADYHLILDGQGVEFHIGGKVIDGVSRGGCADRGDFPFIRKRLAKCGRGLGGHP